MRKERALLGGSISFYYRAPSSQLEGIPAFWVDLQKLANSVLQLEPLPISLQPS